MTVCSRAIATPFQSRLVAITVILCTGAASGGCMTSSGRAYYTAHTSHRIETGPAANEDVAAAFGLDRFAEPGPAVATGR